MLRPDASSAFAHYRQITPGMDLLGAVWLCSTVWMLLALGGLLTPWIGSSASIFLSFALATALTVGLRRRQVDRAPWGLVMALGLAAGLASYPAWVVTIIGLGIAAGLPLGEAILPGGGDALRWVAILVFAPIFEELLYRERILPALRARFGVPMAILGSSALFALPHLEAWNVFGTFLVGLMLGLVFVLTASTALCIGIHAGLNAGGLLWGVPPAGDALSPPTSAFVGVLLCLLAVIATRKGGASWRGSSRGEQIHSGVS